MADYISTLTGSQMDSALLDMAEHNSEAYAVGERNGIEVPPDDVTYHNNARYFAQQAQSIAPASVTEAVRWDVAQTALTDANREQARENIRATPYNYNLLDNSWFLVNSRNVTTVSTNYTYGADRWLLNTGSVTFAVGSMTLAASSNIGQRMDIPNGTYTASVKLSDGTIISGSGTVGNTTTTFISNSTVELDYFCTQSPRNFRIYNTSGSALTIVAVKIELGSFSTLANDTPPAYGEELIRCIYSTADPTDTYANNGFGKTNPNLLDNPWFGVGEIVNQRGVTSGSSVNGIYFIDRWVLTYGNAQGTYSVGSGGVKLTPASSTSVTMYQKFANVDFMNGKTLTASALLSDGTIRSGTISRVNGTLQNFFSADGLRMRFVQGNQLHIDVTLGAGITIRAAKLELGSVSTLANDTPPDYGTELLKCQRYFVRLKKLYTIVGTGYALNATTPWFFAPTPVPLRDGVALTSAISGLYVAAPSGFHAVSAIAIQNSGTAYSASGVFFNATTTGLSSGEVCVLQVRDASGYLDFSADL